MDSATLERVFNPFFTSKTSGTGLGLALSKKIVDAHGGSIEATSVIGQGTEFLLTFPKQLGNVDSSDTAGDPAAKQRTEA
jgi:signal transduction histidine kinase